MAAVMHVNRPDRVVATAPTPASSGVLAARPGVLARPWTPARAGRPRLEEPEPIWFVSVRRTRASTVALAMGLYAGVVLLVGGAAVVSGLVWPQLTDSRGAVALSAITVGLQTLALVVLARARARPSTSLHRQIRQQVAGALLAASAGTSAGAAGLLVDSHAWSAGSVVGAAVAVAGYAAVPTVVGLATAAGLTTATAMSLVAEVGRPTPLSAGAVLLGVGLSIGLLAWTHVLRHRHAGLGLSSLLALAGAQLPLADARSAGWAYGLTLAIGLACLAVYASMPFGTVLAVGVVGTALAVMEATWDLTNGPGRVAATLAAAGAALLAASMMGKSMWRTRDSRKGRLTPRAPNQVTEVPSRTGEVSMASTTHNPRTSDTLRVLDPSDIDQLPWQSVPGCPGVRVSELWRSGDDHDALIAFEPGARTPGPPHRQAQHHIWVISGYASVAGRRITAGSYVYVPPGLAHAVDGVGPNGCTLLQVHRSLAQ